MNVAKSTRRNKQRARPEMNVTPLVDIVLVLLIIFMVLAPVLTGAFGVRLPPQDDTERALDQLAQSDGPLVLRANVDGSYRLGDVLLAAPRVHAALKRVLQQRNPKMLYVDAEDEAAYRHVLVAIDTARNTGADPLIMVTDKR